MSKKQFKFFFERLQEATKITSQASLAKALNISRSAITQQRNKDTVPPKWILNENYVKNGIKRFDSKTHEYGKRVNSGIMICYIISMTPVKIENEVNIYQKRHLPENNKVKFSFDTKLLFKSNQNIKRKNVTYTDPI